MGTDLIARVYCTMSKAADFITKSLLICDRAFVGGAWVSSRSGAVFPVRNPATGATLASVPDMDEHDALSAIQHAYRARTSWSETPAKVGRTVRRKRDYVRKSLVGEE